MKILLTGASGFIGGHILRALQAAGHEVVPITRHHGVDFTQMLTPEAWLPHLNGVDVVINSVGIIAETRGQTFAAVHHHAPAALFRACVMTGVLRVVQISALGADAHAFTPYQLSKQAADEVLRKLPLEWFVLRPSLVYGTGGASMALFQRMAMAQIMRFLIPILHPDNLRMLQHGNTADVQPLAAFLGRMPLRVEEGLCCI
jgi:uncharacterized protein YbjT (DUF2867 family)